jgi:hypothetical protein
MVSALSNPKTLELELGDYGFCTSFGQHAGLNSSDEVVKKYMEAVTLFNKLNSVQNPKSCICESIYTGCLRICFVTSECFCHAERSEPIPKSFLLSFCIKGSVELTGLGKVICYIPDRIATFARTQCNDPTGGLVTIKATKLPITREQTAEASVMKRD